ncbi:hypothetical protein FHS92_001566 [Sphingobium subterraneum]|uniref:Uncharacterized protein n=1 Tax=Sphingobium subterraneum TaxID=627688 RepID=A0A841IZ21_9SPHN|nr:hypothetical protein [Sphingobium subterraneum]
MGDGAGDLWQSGVDPLSPGKKRPYGSALILSTETDMLTHILFECDDVAAPNNAYGAYLRDPTGNKICAFTGMMG